MTTLAEQLAPYQEGGVEADPHARFGTMTVEALKAELVKLGAPAEEVDKIDQTQAELAGTVRRFAMAKEATAKPGRPAEHDHGIVFQGPWETMGDGFSEHVRRCAEALAMTGCPVMLRSLRPRNNDIDPAILDRCAPLTQQSIKRPSYVVQQVVPTPGLLERLTHHPYLAANELEVYNKTRIFSLVYERWPVPADDVAALNRVGQVWVACGKDRQLLIDHGVRTPVHVIPVPARQDDPLLQLRGRQRLPGPPRFYHIGKWEPRKAQDQIILAFLRAFVPGDALLIVKTSKTAPSMRVYPQTAVDAIFKALEDPKVQANGWSKENAGKSVIVKAEQLSDGQMLALHRAGDVYVTLSRGEGYDMPAFDAKLAGNLMVYTPTGAPPDFASPEDQVVPATGDVVAHPFYGWGAPGPYGWGGARYLDFSIDVAAAKMRAAADAIGRGERGTVDLAAYGQKAVGERMLGHLQALAESYGGKVW